MQTRIILEVSSYFFLCGLTAFCGPVRKTSAISSKEVCRDPFHAGDF